MATPPVIPITATPIPTAEQQTQSLPIVTPAFRSFINRVMETVRQGFAQRRPWSELVDRSAFSRPDSLSTATSRIRKNLSYFRVNYAALLASALAISLLSNPFSLIILLTLLASWLFLYIFRPSDAPPLVLFGRQFSDGETLAGLSIVTVVIVFLTNVGSIIISGLVLGSGIIAVHGACRVPEDQFLDEQEPAAATGFLSFLSGATASAAPPVASRV